MNTWVASVQLTRLPAEQKLHPTHMSRPSISGSQMSSTLPVRVKDKWLLRTVPINNAHYHVTATPHWLWWGLPHILDLCVLQQPLCRKPEHSNTTEKLPSLEIPLVPHPTTALGTNMPPGNTSNRKWLPWLGMQDASFHGWVCILVSCPNYDHSITTWATVLNCHTVWIMSESLTLYHPISTAH